MSDWISFKLIKFGLNSSPKMNIFSLEYKFALNLSLKINILSLQYETALIINDVFRVHFVIREEKPKATWSSKLIRPIYHTHISLPRRD